MNTFYFNTGVRPENRRKLYKGQVWRNGTLQIPFDAEAPAHATLLFACDNADQPESKLPNVIVRPIFNTILLSEYAYFKV